MPTKKITFTKKQKELALKTIHEYSWKDWICNFRNLNEETEIPINVLRKITKQLKEENEIYSCSWIYEDWGYCGKWFMIKGN